ncbi:hypothetical protein AMTRI_Chr09g31570 [Amborella trichopoda]
MLRPIQPVHQLASCPTPQSSLSLAIYSTPRPTSSPLIPPQPLFPPGYHFFHIPPLEGPLPPLLPYNLSEEHPSPPPTHLSLPFDNPSSSYSSESCSPVSVDSSSVDAKPKAILTRCF